MDDVDLVLVVLQVRRRSGTSGCRKRRLRCGGGEEKTERSSRLMERWLKKLVPAAEKKDGSPLRMKEEEELKSQRVEKEEATEREWLRSCCEACREKRKDEKKKRSSREARDGNCTCDCVMCVSWSYKVPLVETSKRDDLIGKGSSEFL